MDFGGFIDGIYRMPYGSTMSIGGNQYAKI